MTVTLDLGFTRSQFPAFSEPSLAGQAHFENAGGSYACQQVINRLTNYYRQTKIQPYYPSPASSKAGQQMDQAYIRLAEYLNVSSQEVHIGPSTSQNTATLAHAFRKVLQPGDEIIVTNQDHEANTGVWRQLANAGMVIKEWQISPDTGELDVTQLDELINDKTRLLTLPHCSNVIGQINPVTDICRKAKSAGVMTVVDGVSYAGHGLPDIDAMGADIYLFSLYKVYGPHQGVMTIRRSAAEFLGNQGHFFNADADHIHYHFVPAGPDHAQVAACNGVAEYFDALYQHHFKPEANAAINTRARAMLVAELMHEAEKKLMPPLLDFLEQRTGVRLIGPKTAEHRAPTISIAPAKQDPQQLCEALSQHGIMAGSGHFYAYRAVEALGESTTTGVLRLSFVHYTSPDEIQQLIEALDQVLD
ncbi:MAG: aminotransferase class V-fold PLP-dependent enzyme [Thiolinea sp.]